MINFILDNIPTILTISFAAAFCYIVFTTFRKKNKKAMDDHSKIIFKDKD